jgi:uracil-DNA glycosylase
MSQRQTDLFDPDATHQGISMPSNRLRPEDWPPSLAEVSGPWRELLNSFWQAEVGLRLGQQISASLAAGGVIYPRLPYRALSLTPFQSVQVVVLGQDPYHGANQAEGLAFSVGAGQKIPPSLRNIFKEIQRDTGTPVPAGVNAGSLVRWAEQGVLLLNTALTVEDSLPASHSRWGWEVLTDKIIEALAADRSPRAFLLWGGHAQTKAALIQNFNHDSRHLLLKANHPSPLSALRLPFPFMGCGHFGLVNRWLKAQNKNPVAW